MWQQSSSAAVMACTCGRARMEQECQPWCRSKCATPFFVMDLVTMNRLIVCSRACLDSMPDVLLEAADKSDTGAVLVLHVNENGQQMSTFEVRKSDQQRLDTFMRWIDKGIELFMGWIGKNRQRWMDDGRPLAERHGIPNSTEIAQGHAHMCVCDYTCVYQFQELHGKLLVWMNLFKCHFNQWNSRSSFCRVERALGKLLQGERSRIPQWHTKGEGQAFHITHGLLFEAQVVPVLYLHPGELAVLAEHWQRVQGSPVRGTHRTLWLLTDELDDW